mgnify:CR=1 FL=1
MICEIFFILLAFVLSLIFGIVIIPQITSFCKKKNLYDLPNVRKVHSISIPRMGGTCFMPCMIVAALFSVLVYRITKSEQLTMSLWSFMFLVSIIDDAWDTDTVILCRFKLDTKRKNRCL